MIRHHQHGIVLIFRVKILHNRFHHFLIYILKTFNFAFHISLVGTFIRSLKVHIYKIFSFFKLLYCTLGFSFKMRVPRARAAVAHGHGAVGRGGPCPPRDRSHGGDGVGARPVVPVVLGVAGVPNGGPCLCRGVHRGVCGGGAPLLSFSE